MRHILLSAILVCIQLELVYCFKSCKDDWKQYGNICVKRAPDTKHFAVAVDSCKNLSSVLFSSHLWNKDALEIFVNDIKSLLIPLSTSYYLFVSKMLNKQNINYNFI